jgi:hypothetical protein
MYQKQKKNNAFLAARGTFIFSKKQVIYHGQL